MTLWQLVSTGKFHAPANGTSTVKTACGARIPVTALAKDVDLVDSNDRCRDPKCVATRSV